MNLYEATNYFLEEDGNENGKLLSLLKKVMRFVKLPSLDAEVLKKWVLDHSEEFIKANQIYTKAISMRESYSLDEGVFDILRGLNKNTIIMFVLIAMSALAGNAHASVADLADHMESVANQIKVVDVDITDPHNGYEMDVTGKGQFKKILAGLEPSDLQKIKDMAEKEGLDDWERVKSNLKLVIANSFLRDKEHRLERMDNLSGSEVERLVDYALRQVK